MFIPIHQLSDISKKVKLYMELTELKESELDIKLNAKVWSEASRIEYDLLDQRIHSGSNSTPGWFTAGLRIKRLNGEGTIEITKR